MLRQAAGRRAVAIAALEGVAESDSGLWRVKTPVQCEGKNWPGISEDNATILRNTSNAGPRAMPCNRRGPGGARPWPSGWETLDVARIHEAHSPLETSHAAMGSSNGGAVFCPRPSPESRRQHRAALKATHTESLNQTPASGRWTGGLQPLLETGDRPAQALEQALKKARLTMPGWSGELRRLQKHLRHLAARFCGAEAERKKITGTAYDESRARPCWHQCRFFAT